MTSVTPVTPGRAAPAPNAAVRADAIRVLSRWAPADPGQQALRQAFLGFLAARPDGCARSCEPGHLTASAVVLSQDGSQVLLTLHPRVGRWVQLGGHCEEQDAGLAAAALREATEESGVTGLVIDPEPLHLDVHPITCSLGVPTRHFDVRFLLRAPAGATPVRSAESTELAWWPVHAAPPEVVPALAARRAR
jgi:8-oxo-dGTP pyrophosphatase MutT (NUDIX family)